jgi:LEA14-like dessication related protein
MKHSINNLLLLLFTMTLFGCAELAKHADTIKPTAKLTGTRLANINFEQVDLIFDLAVENKNPITLDLAGLDYELKIENQSLVSGVTAKAINLKANSTSPVQLPVTLKFDDLKKLPGELWNKDKLAYDLQTTFNIILPVIGNYAIPVSKQGEFPVPKIPSIKIKDVKIKNLSFTTAELVAQVEVTNPNDFDLGLSNLSYQLNVNQQNWGQGKINQSSSIPKKGKGIVEIPVTLNLLSAGKSAYNALVNKTPVEYQLTGNATLDTGLELLKGYNLPLDIKGTTSIR